MSSQAASPALGDTAAEAAGGRNDGSMTALMVGAIGLLIAMGGLALGWTQNDPRPFLSWLIGGTFWLSAGIGMLFFIMLFYAFDAGWAIVIRRQMEHAIGAIKYVSLLMIPLLLASLAVAENDFVAWNWLDLTNYTSSGERVGEDVLYNAKSSYLNGPFFAMRFVLFLGAFIVLAELLRKFSFRMDRDGDPKWIHRARFLAGVGIPVAGLTATFLAIDWFKSLSYHWFSTMYGVWFFAACMRAALAVTIIACVYLAARGSLKGIFNRGHSYLLGCLMLAFTVFWAYISFSQYFLQYNANIPEEVFWYTMRGLPTDLSSTWWWVGMSLVFCHFLAPFIWFLWYPTKFGWKIVAGSIWILFFHLADLYYNILPGKVYDPEAGTYAVRQLNPFSLGMVFDLAAIVGFGGICVWAFLSSANKEKPIPVRDPRILESLNCHE